MSTRYNVPLEGTGEASGYVLTVEPDEIVVELDTDHIMSITVDHDGDLRVNVNGISTHIVVVTNASGDVRFDVLGGTAR